MVAAMVGWRDNEPSQRGLCKSSKNTYVRTFEMRLRIFEWRVFF
jgi:hypothetical protein